MTRESKTEAAVAAADMPTETGSNYPPPYDRECRARARAALGDRFGLSDFGVNRIELPPGAWSSQRHWHAQEDEFVYVLEGTPTLITDQGETELSPGMCAGFRAGDENGHHIVNRGQDTAVLLEVGSRRTDDCVDYSDIDMRWSTARQQFSRKNGDPL